MALLLDTNIASELRRSRSQRADPRFAVWAASTDLTSAYVSVITLHEMRRGVLLTLRRDRAQGAVYQAWVDDLLDAFRGRILDVTVDVADRAAIYHVPDPAPFADALIAGTAAVHGLTVATRNTADFARFGVPLVNPWEGPSA